MYNLDLYEEKYVTPINGVKFWNNIPKDLYIRFRINCIRGDDGVYYNRSGEIYFNRFIRYVCDNQIASYWKLFRSYEGPQFDRYLAFNLFEKHTIKLVICHYKLNLSGLLFEDPKHKEMFLIKYGEMFPDSCIIK